nr:unnamed protein product [Callosobruchus chinensis]
MDCTVSKDTPPLVYEDNHHPSLSVQVKLSLRHNKFSNFDSNRENKKYNFRKANYITLFNAFLSTTRNLLSNIDTLILQLQNFMKDFKKYLNYMYHASKYSSKGI